MLKDSIAFLKVAWNFGCIPTSLHAIFTLDLIGERKKVEDGQENGKDLNFSSRNKKLSLGGIDLCFI